MNTPKPNFYFDWKGPAGHEEFQARYKKLQSEFVAGQLALEELKFTRQVMLLLLDYVDGVFEFELEDLVTKNGKELNFKLDFDKAKQTYTLTKL